METADLIRALPGLLLVGVLPGFALATVIAPRWPTWERVVVTPGLSAGVIGVLGLAMRLVHVPFSASSMLPVVALIGAAGFFRFRHSSQHPAAKAPATRAAVRRVVVLGLLAGAVSAGGVAYSLNGQPLPPDWDPPAHGAVVNAIVRNHDVYPSFPVPLEHTSYVRPRMAFEATAALVSELSGPSPAMSMMPLILLALILMPLGLVMLGLETTGSYWVAGLTPLLSTGLAFPAFQVSLGRFPLVFDATLIAAAVVAMARLVQGRDVYTNAAMIAAITAAIWVTHGLEALTAALIGGPLVIELLLRRRSLAPVLRAGAGLAAAGLGAGLVTVLSRVPQGPTPPPGLPQDPGKTIGLFGGSFGPLINPHVIFEYFAQTDLTSPIALGLLAVGVVAAVSGRELLWALASLLLLLAALADVIYPQSLNYFWQNLVWPWGDVDRLLGLAYWVLPLLMAFGLAWAMQLALKASRHHKAWKVITIAVGMLVAATVAARHEIAQAWASLFLDPILLFPFGHNNRLIFLAQFVIPTAGVATIAALAWVRLRLAPAADQERTRWGTLASPPTVAVLAVIALLSLGMGELQELRTYFNNNYYRQLASDADVAAMEKMSRALPVGSRVMTDSTWDAGMWVAALTRDTLLVPNPFTNAGKRLSRPLVLALDDACTQPDQATQALKSFDAIFVGAHRIPNAPDAWDPKCIGALPGLREIARAGPPGAEAHAYEVIGPGG